MLANTEIERCFNALRDSKTVVFDCETSGLSWQRNFICGYVFTVGPRPDETWYLPVRHLGGGNIPGCRIPQADDGWTGDKHWIEERLIEEVAGRTDLHIVAHNAKFDLHMAAAHGIWFAGTVEDTQVNQALIDELQGDFSLENCARVAGVEEKATGIYEYLQDYCRRQGVKCPEGKKSMAHFWRTPANGPAGEYAAQDGVTTWQLWEWQRAVINQQDLNKVHGVECRVTKTLFRMERRGARISESKLALVEDKIESELKKATRALPAGLNVRGPAQVRKFCEELGQTDWPMTEPSKKFPNGQPSFPESFLESFEGGRNIIKVRKLSNLRNSFINGAIRKNLYRGRIHCTFAQLKADEYGTVSGRLSCTHPNLQAIPKRDKVLAPLLRQLFRPMSPFQWWSSDYAQQEYRAYSEYAGAKVILQAYADNARQDYHQLVADLLGVERDPTAKRINLGVIYGMGVGKLAASLGVELPVAQGYLGKMHAMMPEAKSFAKRAENVAKRRGYVKTVLGRRRRFHNGEYTHKAANAIIQGSSADITKLKLAQIDEYLVSEGAESGLVLQIHDSLEFEYLEEERHLLDECMRIMQDFGPDQLIHLQVPMVCDVSTGESWGHATFGNKYKEWV